MSWNDFFFMNSKIILHIYNQLKNTYCTPPLEDVFGIFKYVQLKDIKVVMIGDVTNLTKVHAKLLMLHSELKMQILQSC